MASETKLECARCRVRKYERACDSEDGIGPGGCPTLTAEAALEAAAAPVILIAGGLDKKLDYGDMAPAARGKVRHVLLVGAAGELMGGVLRGGSLFGPQVDCCETVDACLERLLQVLRDGDVLLLKASRAVELDRLVEPLRAALSGERAASVT